MFGYLSVVCICLRFYNPLICYLLFSFMHYFSELKGATSRYFESFSSTCKNYRLQCEGNHRILVW